jgi:hypothetical protein
MQYQQNIVHRSVIRQIDQGINPVLLADTKFARPWQPSLSPNAYSPNNSKNRSFNMQHKTWIVLGLISACFSTPTLADDSMAKVIGSMRGWSTKASAWTTAPPAILLPEAARKAIGRLVLVAIPPACTQGRTEVFTLPPLIFPFIDRDHAGCVHLARQHILECHRTSWAGRCRLQFFHPHQNPH